jgi:hypothetical protein
LNSEPASGISSQGKDIPRTSSNSNKFRIDERRIDIPLRRVARPIRLRQRVRMTRRHGAHEKRLGRKFRVASILERHACSQVRARRAAHDGCACGVAAVVGRVGVHPFVRRADIF